MKDKIKSTEINVNKENIIPIADVKQESQCVLTLELYKDNVAFDITGQTVKLGAKTADGNVQLQESGFTINKNILTVDLKSSINSVVGLVEIDLTFTDSTGIMTTSSFYLNVIKKTLGKDNIIASNQLEAVKVLIEDLKTKGNNTIADIKKDYDSLKKVIIDNNVTANLQVQINENKQQSVENTTRIEQLEDLTPVWQEHEGTGNITVNDSFDGVAKDLTIKGSTLQNLVENGNIKKAIMRGEATQAKYMYSVIPDISNKIYTLILVAENVAKEGVNVSISFNRGTGSQGEIKGIKTGINVATSIIRDIVATELMLYYTSEDIGKLCDVKDIILLEGDYTNKPIPSTHFDSITSSGESEDNKIKIKTVGKNLYTFNKTQTPPWNKVTSLPTKVIENGIRVYRYSGSYHEYVVPTYLKKGTYKSQGEVKYSDGIIRTFDIIVSRYDGANKIQVFRGLYSSSFTIPYDGLYYIGYIISAASLPAGVYADFTDIQIEEGTKSTTTEKYEEKTIEISLPFKKGLKSSLDGSIYDEINISKGEIIQRVSEEYTKLPKENIYKIPKDYLRFFNGTTNILQENNITSILKFEYPLNKDASIVSGLLINDILESEIKNNNNNISELNTKLTENKNDIDYLESKITTSTNDITTLNSKVTTNTNSINDLKTELAKHNIQTNPLWEGVSFLADGQEVTLNKSLDNCRNGVVLVWSQYNTSTNAVINERFAFVFIRKNTIVQNVNKSFGCLIANAGDRVSSYDHIITKYVNVSGARVVGWRGNNQYQNAQSVLRAVYEW